MKIKRGEAGYIHAKKKRCTMLIVLYALVSMAIFVLGLVLNDMSRQNIFTVIAVLGVLPTVKQIVGLIVVIPYHSVPEEKHREIQAHTPENMQLFADLVITSSEKIMHLDYLVVGNRQVIGVLGNGKQELAYVRDYLSKGVANWGSDYKVKIVEREKAFMQELARVKTIESMDEQAAEEEEHVISYLLSLIV